MCSKALFKLRRVSLTVALGWQFSFPVVMAQAPTGVNLSVVPLGAGVIATSKTEREFAVQVQDVSMGPVASAQVFFSVPETAPGAFSDGSRRVMRLTGLDGAAIVPGFKFTEGTPIQVQVEAFFQGQTATTTLLCCDEKLLHPKGSSRRKAFLGVAIGAAAGIGIFYAARRPSNSPIVIRPGTPTLESPH